MKGGVMMSIDTGDYKTISNENLEDGFSYMDNIHSNLSEEMVQRLTNDVYIHVNKIVPSTQSNNETSYSTTTINTGKYIANEHLFNIKDNPDMKDLDGSKSTYYQYGKFDKEKQYSPSQIKVSKSDYADMTKGSTLTNPESMLKNRFSRFSRYGYIDLSGEFLTGTREYLFFSKPDLHLFDLDGNLYEPLRTNPFLVEAFNHYRFSFYSLQQTFSSNTSKGPNDSSVGTVNSNSETIFDLKSKYIHLLSNMATSTLDLGDITANDVEGNKNLYQINTTYREGSLTSDLAYDFSIEFKDTKYLDVYMLFKIYDEYCRHKYMEEIEPVNPDYIMSKIYPEPFSIWKVIVDDTDRIIYWAKAIGVTPMSVPRGAMSNFENQIKITINFKAQFVKDMDPVNLMELNHLTKSSITGSSEKGIVLPSSGETWVGYPWVVADGTSGLHTFARTGDDNASSSNKCYRLMWIDS
jgi:hypothetical protein